MTFILFIIPLIACCCYLLCRVFVLNSENETLREERDSYKAIAEYLEKENNNNKSNNGEKRAL